ncbi:hypothetical protein N5P37_001435, partial [Trichoderma harzianum]
RPRVGPQPWLSVRDLYGDTPAIPSSACAYLCSTCTRALHVLSQRSINQCRGPSTCTLRSPNWLTQHQAPRDSTVRGVLHPWQPAKPDPSQAQPLPLPGARCPVRCLLWRGHFSRSLFLDFSASVSKGGCSSPQPITITIIHEPLRLVHLHSLLFFLSFFSIPKAFPFCFLARLLFSRALASHAFPLRYAFRRAPFPSLRLRLRLRAILFLFSLFTTLGVALYCTYVDISDSIVSVLCIYLSFFLLFFSSPFW